jgi:dienelactone hydrolase
MNHGKELGDPRGQGRVSYKTFAQQFFDRGYAVIIPMRRGFSKSTGPFADDGCDLETNGKHQGEDITLTLNYFTQQPWVDKDHIIIAGQSYGGLTTMGFGTTNYPGVRGLINFAGGLKFSRGCEWQAELVLAFSEYGKLTKIPSLWFYGNNDSFFDTELSAILYRVYTEAGGEATLVRFGPFKADSHGLVGWTDGPSTYWPPIESFLAAVGMP